jgi:hypothetical protein
LVVEIGVALTSSVVVTAQRTVIHALGSPISQRPYTTAEDRQVATFVHNLLAQFAC